MGVDDWDEDGDPWKIVSRRIAFSNPWFEVDAHEVINPVGKRGVYDVVRPRGRAIGVVPLEADGRVHLVGQWRFPLKRYSWEIPEGGSAPGEDPAACAVRELAEETGLVAGRLMKIMDIDLSNSITDETGVVYLATDLCQGDAAPEEVEVLRRVSAPFREVLARVIDGRIRDSLTVAGLLRVHHMAVTGELPPALAQAVLG